MSSFSAHPPLTAYASTSQEMIAMCTGWTPPEAPSTTTPASAATRAAPIVASSGRDGRVGMTIPVPEPHGRRLALTLRRFPETRSSQGSITCNSHRAEDANLLQNLTDAGARAASRLSAQELVAATREAVS